MFAINSVVDSSNVVASEVGEQTNSYVGSSNAEIFLNTFNKIERLLAGWHDRTKYVGFRRMVDSLSQKNSLVDHYKLDLVEYLQLRNAIVHKSTGKPIAEPHQEVVEKIQALYNELQHPLSVLQIAASPVFVCHTTDQVSKIVSTMSREFYPTVPVYHDTHFVGVFSEHSLTKWLAAVADSAEQTDLSAITIGQLQQYFDHKDDKSNAYRFVSKKTDVYSIRESFMTFVSEKKRLGAIFITKTGSEQEEIEGIITAWDLPKIGQHAHSVHPAQIT